MMTTELIAASTSLACVYLGVRANIWNFIFGIISVTLYMIIFYQVRLYADMSLQLVYLILQFTGWYEWLYGNKNRTPLKIRSASYKVLIIATISTAMLFYVSYFILKNYTNSNTIYIDAFTTALSVVGQLMMNRKWVEGWLFFFVADVVSIKMYTFKHLYYTAGLFGIFTVLALMGYIHWRKRCYD
jgi:nicotinamide mononucleotide transporter